VTEVVQWIDPDGVTTTLEHMSFSNRFMPKVVFDADGVPGQPGEVFREVEHGPREFGVVFDVVASGESATRTAVREMVKKLNPKRGPGTLRVTSPVGDQRQIVCRYSAGAELDEKVGDDSGPDWQRFPAVFIAHDPYWYDVSPIEQSFVITAQAPNFFPILPIHLAASELAVDSSVDNTGDVQAWPVWTITGPGSGIKLSNLTTGRFTWLPSLVLAAGQVLVIDSRPGAKSVFVDGSVNAYAYLSNDSSMWPFDVGMNGIRLEMSGADNVVSQLTMRYYRRFLSP
jgi:phage-related protein